MNEDVVLDLAESEEKFVLFTNEKIIILIEI